MPKCCGATGLSFTLHCVHIGKEWTSAPKVALPSNAIACGTALGAAVAGVVAVGLGAGVGEAAAIGVAAADGRAEAVGSADATGPDVGSADGAGEAATGTPVDAGEAAGEIVAIGEADVVGPGVAIGAAVAGVALATKRRGSGVPVSEQPETAAPHRPTKLLRARGC